MPRTPTSRRIPGSRVPTPVLHPSFVVLVAMLGFACSKDVGRAHEPWMQSVPVEVRVILSGLLSADERVRVEAASDWMLAEWRAADLPTAPRELVRRRESIHRGLDLAFARGSVPVRVAAVRSSIETAPDEISSKRLDRLRAMVAAARSDPDDRVRAAGVEALDDLALHLDADRAAEHVAALLAYLDRPGVLERCAALEALDGCARLRILEPDDLGRFDAAVRAASSDVDPRLRTSACLSWGSLFPIEACLARAREALRDPDASVRGAGARLVASQVHDGEVPAAAHEGLLEGLRAVLEEPDLDARSTAAHALWAITGSYEGLVPILRQELAASEGGWAVVSTLGILTVAGPDAVSAAPEIFATVGTVEPDTHMFSGEEPMQALYSVGADLARVRGVAVDLFESDEPDHRRRALVGLRAVHADGEALAELVLPYLVDERDEYVRYAAAALLADRCSEDTAAIEYLRDWFDRSDPGVFAIWPADFSAERLGVRGAPLVGRLAAMLDRLSAARRPEFVRSTARGSRKAKASSLGFDLDGDLGEQLAGDILRMLVEIGTPEAILVVVDRLEHEAFGELALEELAKAGAAAGPAVEPCLGRLQSLLDDARGERAIFVARAIRRAGGSAEPCIESLQRELASSDDDVRRHAARELGEWERAAAPALEDLRRLRDREDAHSFDADVLEAAIAACRVGAEMDADMLLVRCRERLALSGGFDSSVGRAITALGPEARGVASELAETVPVLVAAALAWRDAPFGGNPRDVGETRAALEALGAIGPVAAGALPAIRSLGANRLFQDAAAEAERRILGRQTR